MKILQSIGAVFAGLMFIVATHSGVDFVLETLGIFTPPGQRFETPWMLVTATAYRTILSVAGCFLTGILAPSRPMLHAIILGFVGFFLSSVAAVVIVPVDLSPTWYPIALVVLAIPSAWIGGRLAERHIGELS